MPKTERRFLQAYYSKYPPRFFLAFATFLNFLFLRSLIAPDFACPGVQLGTLRRARPAKRGTACPS